MLPPPPRSTLFPYTTLFRSVTADIYASREAQARVRLFQGEALNGLDGVREVSLHPGRNEVEFKRSEEHTSELQSRRDLVCRLLLEKKKKREQLNQQPKTEEK